jgi:antitoxin component YwqK of YwqJK toxin-antitoxin module
MLGYLGYVRISDGQHSVDLNEVSDIYIKTRSGRKIKVKIGTKDTTSTYYGQRKVGVILGHKITKGRGLIEDLTYGKRHYFKDKMNFPYRKGTWTGLDGTIWKRSKIGKDKGICHTTFKNGKFVEQWFNYSNGFKAFHYVRSACDLVVKYPNGKPRMEYVGDKLIYDSYKAKSGEPCLPNMNDSLNESCTCTEYARNGRIINQVNIKNRQINGECIKNGIKYFYVNGLAVPKKLYDAKPEDIDPKCVLRIENAQVRGMMLKKVGLNRLVKECGGKLIDRDESTGNELYDFPVKYDKSGTDEMDRFERVLKVICTSTRQEYFLRIPAHEKFATCENARQGTFNGFDPDAKHIVFAQET